MKILGTAEEVLFLLKQINKNQVIEVNFEFEDRFNEKTASGRKAWKDKGWEEPEFYKAVKIKLAERSMTLLELCEELEIKQSYLSQILFEKRKGKTAEETKKRVAELLGLK